MTHTAKIAKGVGLQLGDTDTVRRSVPKDRMRILFVSTTLPIPTNNGSTIRSLSIVQGLASIGHELDFISFVDRRRPESLDPLPKYCREISLVEQEIGSVSQGAAYLRRAQCLLGLKSYSIERFRSARMQARIESHLEANAFDAIVCDSLYALVNVPKTNVPIVLNCHNVEHQIFERYTLVETSFVKKWYATLEARMVRDAESLGCQRVALAMVCSGADKAKLRQLDSKLPICVIPNAVDTDSYRPSDTQGLENTLLYQGGMDWYPNRDAVEFFARAILPEVRRDFPGIRFTVAGRNPPAEFVAELGVKHQVEFTGTVPDMRPYLSQATVVVVPIRLGSGTRIKILEACAAGVPVVSTTIGAEGLDFTPGKEIVLADDPSEFASAVVTLLRDRGLRDSIGGQARAAVVDRYSQSVVKRSLDKLLFDGIADAPRAVSQA